MLLSLFIPDGTNRHTHSLHTSKCPHSFIVTVPLVIPYVVSLCQLPINVDKNALEFTYKNTRTKMLTASHAMRPIWRTRMVALAESLQFLPKVLEHFLSCAIDEVQNPLPLKTMLFKRHMTSIIGISDTFPNS